MKPTQIYYTIAQAAPLAGTTESAIRGELQRSPNEFRGCPVLRADNGRIRFPAVQFLEALGLLDPARDFKLWGLRASVCDATGVDPLGVYKVLAYLVETSRLSLVDGDTAGGSHD